jgi:streptogramin lyase
MKHFSSILLALALLLFTASAQTINNDVFSEVVPLIQSGDISTPLDAAPNSRGETVYFIASSASGIGVFQVPMLGGAATEVKVGEPFMQPASLAMSSDDKWIFVADTEAQGGVIFRLSLEDNTISTLAGTEGTAPRGLEVVLLNGEDQVYFTGQDLGDGQMAVFRVAPSGGEPVVLAKGAPFENLSGVTATEEGVAFVSDRGQETNQGVIYRIDDAVTPIAQNLNLGNPAGLALTPDASILAISSLSNDGHAQVVLINLSTLESSIFNRVIGENVSAGGLHRSHGSSEVVFAWADVDGGQVYKVKPPKP